MATLFTKNFALLVQEWAVNVQASVAEKSSVVLDFTKGSIFRALAEAQASVALWLQGLILKLLTVTRLSTSKGIDVDTWLADYMPGAAGGVLLPSGATSPRLPGNAATGDVTFARAIPTYPAIVKLGDLVASSDGTQDYEVIADPLHSAYSANAGGVGVAGYTIPAAVSSLAIPVRFIFPDDYAPGTYTGPVGNVQIGGITILKTGISGVDTVTNTAAFTNGYLAESDADAKKRFPLYIASLAKGTEGAIGYAVVSVQQGLLWQLWEPGIGGFTQLTVYVDDGTGAIPADTLEAVRASIYATKAAGVPIAIFGATPLAADVSMVITTADGYYHPTVVAEVVAAIGLYIGSLGLGKTPADGMLSYMKLAQIAFDASPGVVDVLSYSLNGSTADVTPAAGQVIVPGTIIVS